MPESTRDPLMDPLLAALADAALGIPNPICYATTPDRLLACSLVPGHDGRHNSRRDGSGVEWTAAERRKRSLP
jgi:hypothetical protein